MAEDVKEKTGLEEKNYSKIERYKNSCYICLNLNENILIKVEQKLQDQLIEFGLVFVKTTVSSESLCISCFNDVQSFFETFDRIQNANIFWRNLYLKAGYCVEKPESPSELKTEKNLEKQYTNETNIYKCPRCDLNFMTKTCLNHHSWKDHLRLKEDPTRCTFCKKKYQHERNCRKHVFLCHEDEKTHLCTVCGKSGMNRATLRLHCLSKHDGAGWVNEVTWYTCEICKGIRFSTIENYHKHMHECHEVERPVEEISEIVNSCDVEEVYESVPSPAYEISFRDETNIESEQIDKTENKQELEIQEVNKLSEADDSEMQQVEYLEEDFDEIMDIESIEETFSKSETKDPNIGIESYQCPQCNQWFSRYFYYLHIWEHFRNPDKPSTCKFCDRELKTEESCRKHFLFKHFEKFQICEVCGKRNMTQLELFHHKRANHLDIYKEEIESRKVERQIKRESRYKLMSLTELEQVQVENNNYEDKFEASKKDSVTTSLKCPACDRVFNGTPNNTTIELHKHIWKSHKRLADKKRCPDCDKSFEEEFLAKKHYFFMHFEPYYSCDNCQKSGMTYKQLTTHLQHELKLIKAGVCVKQETEKKYNHQNRKNLNEEKRTCPVCKENFFGTNANTTSAYLKHAWDAHGKGSDPKRCIKCNKTFDTEFYARKHFLHLHWDQTFTCEYCSLSKLTKMQLYHHKNIVHKMTKNKRPELNCPYCCQKFKDPVKFENHKQNHEDTANQPKLICELCKKGYSNIHSLKEHQLRAHIKVFSHHCRYCDRGFYSSGSRNTHEISMHTKQYPFKCRFCGLETTQMANLKLHIQRAHDIHNDVQVTDAIIRQVSRKKRTKEEIDAQKIYVKHIVDKNS